MYVDFGVPAILPLAFARMDVDGVEKSVMLGMTLQHPPLHAAVAKQAQIQAYGPRAHVMHAAAQRYADSTASTVGVEIKIESTTPSLVGFGSDSTMALMAAQAMAWANDHDHEDVAALAAHVGVDDPLAFYGYTQGGVLLVELDAGEDGAAPQLLRRFHLKHRDNKAWATVFHFPRIGSETLESIEQDRLALVRQAAKTLSAETGTLINEKIWPALEADNLADFAAGLMTLREQNAAALVATGDYPSTDEHTQKVYDVYQENGAVAWGDSHLGLGLFGLLEGALRSQETRKKLVAALGFGFGQHDATITDNQGVNLLVKDAELHLHDYPLPNLVDGITGIGRNRPDQ